MAKRIRKIKVNATQNVTPAMLALPFYASVPDVQDNALTVVETLDYDDTSDARDVLTLYRETLAHSFIERIQFEESKQAFHCADTVKAHAKRVVNKEHVSRAFFESRVVPDFINRSQRDNYRLNEKTCDRMIDAGELLSFGFLPDAQSSSAKYHYIAAIFRSIARFEAANVTFETKHAFAACSNERVFSEQINALMSYNWKKYGSGTQNPQSSMTLNALVELHAIVERKIDGKTTYKVNRESYAGERLAQILNV